MTPGIQWTEHNARKLLELHKLLDKVSGLNHGNMFLENIQECITIAESLKRTPEEDGTNFLMFLYDLCLKDRKLHIKD